MIGLLETHGRAETAALADGFEIVPRREVVYRGTTVTEMDLPAILARAPRLCLIDELAHTNSPGLEHSKRFEDVEDVLAAGIDVSRHSTCSTSSRSMTSSPSTAACGCAKRCPTRRCSGRMRSCWSMSPPRRCSSACATGKVYPAERIDAALNGFFRIENLTALRETALRQVAEEVVSKRVRRARRGALGAGGRRAAAGARRSRSRALSGSCAARGARPNGSAPTWTSCGCSRPVARPTTRPSARSFALRQLISVLGAHLVVRESDDVVEAAAAEIRERGTTYVLLGESPPRRGLGRLREPLPQRIMRAAPRGVDVRIVAARREK